MRVCVRLARNWRILFTSYHGNNKRLRVWCVLHAPITLLFPFPRFAKGREKRESDAIMQEGRGSERSDAPRHSSFLLPPLPYFHAPPMPDGMGKGRKSLSPKGSLSTPPFPLLLPKATLPFLFSWPHVGRAPFPVRYFGHMDRFSRLPMYAPLFSFRSCTTRDLRTWPTTTIDRRRSGREGVFLCTVRCAWAGSTLVFWDPLGKKPSTVTGAKMDLCARKAAKQHFPASYPPLSSRILSKSRGKHTGGGKALKIGGLRICIADEVGKVFALLTPHSEFSLAYIFSTFHFRA